MPKQKVDAYIITENISDPVRPSELEVIDKNSLFFLRFKTRLQSFNVFNRNNRMYMGNSMMQALKADHIMELQRKGSWIGEFGHPSSDDPKRILTIDPKMACHRIVSHTVNNSFVDGVVETLDNDGYGRQFAKMILQGVEPAFSLRALAGLTKRSDGKSVVQGKVHVVNYDAVILPSHPDAYRDETTPIQKIYKAVQADGNTMKECTCMPLTESAIMDFIAMESGNVKFISSVCDVAMEGMTLSEDLKNVILKESGATYVVPLEERIKYEVNNFMLKL